MHHSQARANLDASPTISSKFSSKTRQGRRMVGGIAAESQHLTIGFPFFGLAATAGSPESEQALDPELVP